eukprot:jgi/Mesvir1/19213/Mv11522-RA.1
MISDQAPAQARAGLGCRCSVLLKKQELTVDLLKAMLYTMAHDEADLQEAVTASAPLAEVVGNGSVVLVGFDVGAGNLHTNFFEAVKVGDDTAFRRKNLGPAKYHITEPAIFSELLSVGMIRTLVDTSS